MFWTYYARMCKSLLCPFLGPEGSRSSAVPCLLLSFRLNYRPFAWSSAASWISLLAVPVLLHFLSTVFCSRVSGLCCSLLTEASGQSLFCHCPVHPDNTEEALAFWHLILDL